MKLSIKQVEQLLERMNQENVEDIVIRENGNGKVNFYVPVTKLEQFPLQKRGRKSKPVFTP